MDDIERRRRHAEAQRRYTERHPDRVAETYRRRDEKRPASERHRLYREQHPEAARKNQRKYRDSDRGQVVARRFHATEARLFPERKAAWYAVHRATTVGALAREVCRDCGAALTQAHHHKGYEVAHQLDVVWLCPPCHRAEHRRLNAAKP